MADRRNGSIRTGMNAIQVEDLTKHYGDVRAVDGISFAAPAGSTIGKSIIFARNHLHAVQLKELFDELYDEETGLPK